MNVRASTFRVLRAAVILAGGLVVAGCATTAEEGTPGDPLESFNRNVYAFNKTVDEAVLQPVARGYQAATPAFADRAITNFFNNLGDVGNAINNVLQLKLTDAVEDAGRIAVNSTLGLGGLIDMASGFGIERHDEDFGQTLGYWGMDSGPYLVLPLLGPSSVRDAIGRGVDMAVIDPVTQIGGHDTLELGLSATRITDRRADLLGTEAVLGVAAWDEYSFVRDAYLQRRESAVLDEN